MKSALRFLLNGILWCAPVGVMAQSYEGFLYTNTGTTITITGYTGTNGLLTIPSAIDGLPVTGIGDSAFQWLLGSGSLASVTIPASVTTIGDYAFFEQAGTLTNVLVPNSVTSIGAYAFAVCPSLTNIAIPASVTNLGEAAFESCGIRGAIIPAAITSIADSAFAGSSFLQSLTLPDTVTSIGDRAFSGCGRLQALTIPDAVTNIGAAAFEGCQSLPSLTLPAGITTIIRLHPIPAANFTCSSSPSIAFLKASSSPRVALIGRLVKEGFSFNSFKSDCVASRPSFIAPAKLMSVPR